MVALITNMQEKTKMFIFFFSVIKLRPPPPLKHPFLHNKEELLKYCNIYLFIRLAATDLIVKVPGALKRCSCLPKNRQNSAKTVNDPLTVIPKVAKAHGSRPISLGCGRTKTCCSLVAIKLIMRHRNTKGV